MATAAVADRKGILREPLFHFIVAGAVLFGAFSLFADAPPATDEERSIVVDRRALLTYMQYRANAFEPEAFAAALDSMPAAELEPLIDAYIEEELLYREALSFGLADSDYIIRQRMVQKMGFLLGDIADAGTAVDEAELAAFFEANIALYAIEPSVTFTHVFFDADRRGDDEAQTAAQESLAQLDADSAGFNDATGVGDRFPFLRNYVDRTFDFVASHFGTQFAEELQALPASDGQWQGPLRSAYGLHGVLVTERNERRIPELAEVRSIVEADYLQQRSNEALAQMTDALRDSYDIVIGDIQTAAAGDEAL